MQYPVMVLETKHCNGCGEDKELSEFYIHKSGKEIGKLHSNCKNCERIRTAKWEKANSERVNAKHRAWYKANPEKARKTARECSYRKGVKPASENKSSPLYLGCVVAETVLSHEFPGFKRMPYGNPDYDYECPKGFKIDVKSGCRRRPRGIWNDRWCFTISKNKMADYFLCLAFDNRKSLTPEHVWLIPGSVVNMKTMVTITNSSEILAKWSKYARPLGNVLECCNKLRGDGEHDITQDVNTDAKS